MSEMLEKILSDDNIENAYKRVYAIYERTLARYQRRNPRKEI